MGSSGHRHIPAEDQDVASAAALVEIQFRDEALQFQRLSIEVGSRLAHPLRELVHQAVYFVDVVFGDDAPPWLLTLCQTLRDMDRCVKHK
jgi:hypothetical protein